MLKVGNLNFYRYIDFAITDRSFPSVGHKNKTVKTGVENKSDSLCTKLMSLGKSLNLSLLSLNSDIAKWSDLDIDRKHIRWL